MYLTAQLYVLITYFVQLLICISMINKEKSQVIVKLNRTVKLDLILQRLSTQLGEKNIGIDPNEILSELLFEDYIEEEVPTSDDTANLEKANSEEPYPKGKTYVLALPEGTNVDSFVDGLEQLEGVIYAQEDQSSGLF